MSLLKLLPAPKQLLLGPPTKIGYLRLHEAVIESGTKLKLSIPIKAVKGGGLFRRAIPSERLGDGSKTSVIFSKVGGDTNRYDGKTAKGNTAPVIYLSTDTDAARAEGLYYSKHPDKNKTKGTDFRLPVLDLKRLGGNPRLWLPTQTIVTYRTAGEVALADFRMDSTDGMRFLKELNQDADVRAALKLTPYSHLVQALQATDDYSVSRALAYLADKVLGANGSTWNTARISRNADRFSDNATLKGEEQKPVEGLRPLFAQEYFEVNGNVWYVVKKLDPTVNPYDFAMFPEGERVEPQVPGIEDEFTR